MNKLALATAIATALSFASYSSAEGPIDSTIYGKANLSIVNSDNGSTDQWNLNSNASRLGVKGKTKIGEGLYAIYKAEFEVCIDDGDCKGQTFSQRNIMAGVEGSFGTVFAGKHDTPTKLAQSKIDLFNDLEGDIKNTFEGENRVSNMVAYTSPSVNGFSGTLAAIPAEGTDVDGDGQNDTGLTDGMSYSLNYSMDNLYLAIAGDQDVDSQDLLRIVGQYSVDALKLGLMYQQNEDNSGSKDESGYFISAAYKVDKITYKAQFGSIEDDVDGDEENTFSLGADYKISSKTKAYLFYTDNTDSAIGSSDDEDSAFGIGMEYKF
ncbi:MAG: porin [Porticoccaceae bacterium]|jgi:predicted porin|nr:porin [Porticoccaceae bacterium]MBT5577442.1 porin [Porticoccaceae bacterium]